MTNGQDYQIWLKHQENYADKNGGMSNAIGDSIGFWYLLILGSVYMFYYLSLEYFVPEKYLIFSTTLCMVSTLYFYAKYKERIILVLNIVIGVFSCIGFCSWVYSYLIA